MARKTLNLGILAHVDAGKTTLTERLLYAAGVIDEVGSVDKGTTKTDTLPLERRRGITIKSAVVSFALGGVTVNLIDTPGHPDFIAEVERVLGVLDGAVLAVSAVEGVQPQTRIFMRALRRLRVPTLVFVNKIDRAGAGEERVLDEISARLTPSIVALGSVRDVGTRAARFAPAGHEDAAFGERLAAALAEHDDVLLAELVDGLGAPPYSRLRAALAAQTERVLVHPVFFGSALTGAGVEALMAGIAELLPAAERDADGPVSGTVFKIERGPAAEKIAYVRMFSGTLRVRDRARFGANGEGKITAISVFADGVSKQRPAVVAGEIAKVGGIADIRIGDRIGDAGGVSLPQQFAPPTLESVVVPRRPEDKAALRVALAQLAEQDPLIAVRQDDERQELSVSLYGEVQREVIEATLSEDFGLDVTFREATTICVERPSGAGEALEVLRARTKTNVTGKSSPTSSNPFPATLGLRVEPAPTDRGVDVRLDVDVRLVPIYIYRTVDTFVDHVAHYVRETLREGLSGWTVTDCTVTVTDCGYRAPGTTAGDFRKLTQLVLMQALERAGTTVFEPVLKVTLEAPIGTLGAVLALLARLGATVGAPSPRGELATIETTLPAARVRDLVRELPATTAGEGVLESELHGHEPVAGTPPTRRRTTPNPLNRAEYLLHLARRTGVSGGGTG